MLALVEVSAPPSSVLITACPIAVSTGLCFTGPGFAYGKIDDELPHPFPLIYTITSPDVCFAEVFPIPERTTVVQPPPSHPHISRMPRADLSKKEKVNMA